MDAPPVPIFNAPHRPLAPSQSTPTFPPRENPESNSHRYYTPDDLNRLRAMRVAQVRAQAAPYAHPPPPSYHPKRAHVPPHARSMPSLDTNRNPPIDNRSFQNAPVHPIRHDPSVVLGA